jgi:hypothetical protein
MNTNPYMTYSPLIQPTTGEKNSKELVLSFNNNFPSYFEFISKKWLEIFSHQREDLCKNKYYVGKN